MKAFTSTTFDKEYDKLPEKVKEQFRKRIKIFLNDPYNRSLNVHKLQGNKKHLCSMNVIGDCRALFQYLDKKTVRFRHIGTHSQLY